MSLRDDVLPIIRDGWQIVADLGFSPYTVTVRTRTWSLQVGDGTTSDSDLTLTPSPWVKELQGGKRLKVGPIVPAHTGGGYTPQQLNPLAYLSPSNTTVEILHVVTGPDGVARNYVLADIDTSDAVEYTLTLEALDPAEPQ